MPELRGLGVWLLCLMAGWCLACERSSDRQTATSSGESSSATDADAADAEPITAVEALVPVPFERLPVLFDDGDWDSLSTAIRLSRKWLARRPADQVFVFGPRQVSVRQQVEALDQVLGWLAEDPTPEALATLIVQAFDVLESVGNRGEMLITGYYVPVIEGSLRRSAAYQVPVYGPPGNLIRVDLGLFSDRWKGMRTAGRLVGGRLVPYPDREEIRRTDVLRGREIAWAGDRVELFFVEVQGSGVLRLPDGNEIRIGYAGANGRDYRSIGKLLIEEGKIERAKVSMQSIRTYLSENPEEIDRVLDYNQSVVFFRRLSGSAVGSLGVPVTARRSVATDHRVFPRGALGFLVTDLPAMGPNGETVVEDSLTRFVLNQDRGGAIRGPGRVDFFWGRGTEAAERAGVMKQPGRLFFLVPKVAKAAEDNAGETQTPAAAG